LAKTVAEKAYYTFVKGLHTEAGPLTFPPNTWQEGTNVVPDINGSLSKRTGINYESGYSLSTATNTPTEKTTGAFIADYWNTVGGSGGRNFLVVQRAGTVYFYDNTSDTISTTIKSFTIDLSTYQVAGNPNVVGFAPIRCVSANGKLVIVSDSTTPILVTYTAATDSISVAPITVEIRDLYGVNDGLPVSASAPTLTAEHHYNLLNQGWDNVKITAWNAYTTNNYPSNAQTWTAGKDSNDDFSPALLGKQDFGTSPAPKGRFVLDVFSRDRATVSGIPGIASEIEYYRPSTCAFFAGRAWYAGIQSTTLSSWVLFSQVADTDDKYGNCYQDADPTSEVISDLVATDGGVIPIQDAGNIVRIMAAYNSIVVFADNGVWQILGSSDSGFSATAYEVRKLSNIGCIGHDSVIEAEQVVMYWSSDGIWAMKPNDAGSFDIISATDTTIKTEFESIPKQALSFVKGTYLLDEKTVYWLYNSDAAQDGIIDRFKRDKLLCFDVRLGAFYTLTVSSLASDSPIIVSALVTKTGTNSTATFNVVDASENQVVSGSDTVVATINTTVTQLSNVVFVTVVPVSSGTSYKLTIASFEDGITQAARWVDWYSANSAGITYDAYIVTGYDMGADQKQGGAKSMQGLYFTSFMNRTEEGVDGSGNAINDSSCTMQSRWDWTNNSAANKWSTTQQCYRHRRVFNVVAPSATYEDGYPVVVAKNKVRGRGRAVHFKLQGAAGKDMQIIGWHVTYLGNGNV
jgi:hypothetical protein